jgi:tetrahydromethanopterin S-methyltransferase subunit G
MDTQKVMDKDKKENYMVTMLKDEIKKRDKRIKELEDRTEFTYIEEIKKNFDKALARKQRVDTYQY